MESPESAVENFNSSFTTKKKRHLVISDDESDDDDVVTEDVVACPKKVSSPEKLDEPLVQTHRKSLKLFISDDESDNGKETITSPRKVLKIVDTEEADDEAVKSSQTSSRDEVQSHGPDDISADEITSLLKEYREELERDTTLDEDPVLKSLIDRDTDSENDVMLPPPATGRWQQGKGAAKKPTQKKSTTVEKTMENDRLQIHKDSQKMIRAAPIAIPYHEPKNFKSFREFQEALRTGNCQQSIESCPSVPPQSDVEPPVESPQRNQPLAEWLANLDKQELEESLHKEEEEEKLASKPSINVDLDAEDEEEPMIVEENLSPQSSISRIDSTQEPTPTTSVVMTLPADQSQRKSWAQMKNSIDWSKVKPLRMTQKPASGVIVLNEDGDSNASSKQSDATQQFMQRMSRHLLAPKSTPNSASQQTPKSTVIITKSKTSGQEEPQLVLSRVIYPSSQPAVSANSLGLDSCRTLKDMRSQLQNVVKTKRQERYQQKMAELAANKEVKLSDAEEEIIVKDKSRKKCSKRDENELSESDDEIWDPDKESDSNEEDDADDEDGDEEDAPDPADADSNMKAVSSPPKSRSPTNSCLPQPQSSNPHINLLNRSDSDIFSTSYNPSQVLEGAASRNESQQAFSGFLEDYNEFLLRRQVPNQVYRVHAMLQSLEDAYLYFDPDTLRPLLALPTCKSTRTALARYLILLPQNTPPESPPCDVKTVSDLRLLGSLADWEAFMMAKRPRSDPELVPWELFGSDPDVIFSDENVTPLSQFFSQKGFSQPLIAPNALSSTDNSEWSASEPLDSSTQEAQTQIASTEATVILTQTPAIVKERPQLKRICPEDSSSVEPTQVLNCDTQCDTQTQPQPCNVPATTACGRPQLKRVTLPGMRENSSPDVCLIEENSTDTEGNPSPQVENATLPNVSSNLDSTLVMKKPALRRLCPNNEVDAEAQPNVAPTLITDYMSQDLFDFSDHTQTSFGTSSVSTLKPLEGAETQILTVPQVEEPPTSIANAMFEEDEDEESFLLKCKVRRQAMHNPLEDDVIGDPVKSSMNTSTPKDDNDDDDDDLPKLPPPLRRRVQLMEDDDEQEDEKEEEVDETDDDGDNEGEEDEEEVEEEDIANDEEELLRQEVLGFQSKPMKDTKFKLDHFLETEAELSGSEAASEDEDEENNLPEEDEYEQEEGDLDPELPSFGVMRRQLEKVHMRLQQDDDDREIRILQEMYLEDGDLHDDTQIRKRRFRWHTEEKDNEGELSAWQEADVGMEEHDAASFLTTHLASKGAVPIPLSKGTTSDEMGSKNADETSNEAVLLKRPSLLSLGKQMLKKSQSVGIVRTISTSGSTMSEPFNFLATSNTTDLRSESVCPVPTLFKQPSLVKRDSFLSRNSKNLGQIRSLLHESSENRLKSRAGAMCFTSGAAVSNSKAQKRSSSSASVDSVEGIATAKRVKENS